MVLVTVPYFDRLRRSSRFHGVQPGVLAPLVGLRLAVAAQFNISAPSKRRSIPFVLAAFAALRFDADVEWVGPMDAGIAIFVL